MSSDGESVEFSVHGVVGVRFDNASPADLRNVIAPLRLAAHPLQGTPDITVRFEPAIETGTLALLGHHTLAHDAHSMYLMGKASNEIEASIPFDRIGGACNLVCRSGLTTVPLLADIVMLTFACKGYVHLHASAFALNGEAVILAGWSNGGKTDALLAFAEHGADYLGDEILMLSPDGQRLLGIPIPLTVWDWQLAQIPSYLHAIRVPRLRIGVIRALDRLYRRLHPTRLGASAPLRVLDKALPSLRAQLKSGLPARALVKHDIAGPGPVPRRLFMLHKQTAAEVDVRPCDPRVALARMDVSSRYERLHFYQFYRAWQFAFPERGNAFLDGLDEAQSAAMPLALRDLETFSVHLPHGLAFERLYESMRPYCA